MNVRTRSMYFLGQISHSVAPKTNHSAQTRTAMVTSLPLHPQLVAVSEPHFAAHLAQVYQGGTEHGGTRIWVGSLAYGTNEEDLRRMFSEVRNACAPYQVSKGQSPRAKRTAARLILGLHPLRSLVRHKRSSSSRAMPSSIIGIRFQQTRPLTVWTARCTRVASSKSRPLVRTHPVVVTAGQPAAAIYVPAGSPAEASSWQVSPQRRLSATCTITFRHTGGFLT